MKKINFKRGFTLIELLVVVAIIGILAAVVLASLNTARSKGADAAIKADLANTRVQAALFYDNNAQTYGSTVSTTTDCTTGSLFADPTITAAITQAQLQAGTANVACTNTATTFAIAALLKTLGAGYYCVDSTGAGKVNTTATGLVGAGTTNAINTTTGLCS